MTIRFLGVSSGGADEELWPSTESSTSDFIQQTIQESDTYTAMKFVSAWLSAVKDFLTCHPRLMYIAVAVLGVLIACVVMGIFLRVVHWFVDRVGSRRAEARRARAGRPLARRDGDLNGDHWESFKFDLSVWGPMENPARVLIGLLAIMEVGILSYPSSAVATQYLRKLCIGGGLLCLAWYLHGCKVLLWKRCEKRWFGDERKDESTAERKDERKDESEEERLDGCLPDHERLAKIELEDHQNEIKEQYENMTKLASFGWVILAGLEVAVFFNLSISSLLAIGGIGGAVAAYAAKELLSNMLSGIVLIFSKSFIHGDTIKAGTVEGKVKRKGIMSTHVTTLENAHITVPNSFFTSQAVYQTSRTPDQLIEMKIPMRIVDFETVPKITDEIRMMIRKWDKSQSCGDDEAPQCRVSQVSEKSVEVTISCTITKQSKCRYLRLEEKILVDSAKIMIKHGATVADVSTKPPQQRAQQLNRQPTIKVQLLGD